MQEHQEIVDDLNENVVPIKSNEFLDYSKWWLSTPQIVMFKTPDNEAFTQSYNIETKISEVKEVLQTVFSVDKSLMELSLCGKKVEDTKQLKDFGCKCLILDLKSTNLSRYISGKCPYKDISIPNVITVKVTYDDGKTEDLKVEMVNQTILKPFIGGFKNSITNIEYHNGYTQTGPSPPKIAKNHRDTQTYSLRNRKQQINNSVSTQMTNSKIYIPNLNDKIITAKPYITADEIFIDFDKNIRIIQRYAKAWILKRRLKTLHEEYCKRIRLENEENEFASRSDSRRKMFDLIGKIYPKTKTDFYTLYAILKNWKAAETKHINKTTCGPARKAEMYLLLEKEIEILKVIEKQKKIVKNDMKIKQNINFLKTIGNPIAWNSNYKDLPVKMDTLETQAGFKYLETFTKLCDCNLTYREKLSTYLDIKISLEKHANCKLGIALSKLCDRMCQMISSGISEKHLTNLAKRIEACFIKHLRFPACCENVTMRLSKTLENQMQNNLTFCKRCQKYKTQDKFNITSKITALKVCSNCSWNDRIIEPWIDLKPYRYMLECIRREERRFSAISSVAFILTDKDIHYIVTEIWQSHSTISECSDLYKLRLCRFFKEFDWAPWNCILLTYEEAKVHSNIRNFHDVYAEEVLKCIRNNHTIAEIKYKSSFKLNAYFQEIGKVDTRWNEIKDVTRYIPINKETHFLKCH